MYQNIALYDSLNPLAIILNVNPSSARIFTDFGLLEGRVLHNGT